MQYTIPAIQKDAQRQNAEIWRKNMQMLATGFIWVKVSCQFFSFYTLMYLLNLNLKIFLIDS